MLNDAVKIVAQGLAKQSSSKPVGVQTAMMLAAADKTLRWRERTSQGIVKVLILLSDSLIQNHGSGTKPGKGDGTDKCKEVQNPANQFVGSVLNREKISVFGVFGSDVRSAWKKVTSEMGVRFGYADRSTSNDKLRQHLDKFVRAEAELF